MPDPDILWVDEERGLRVVQGAEGCWAEVREGFENCPSWRLENGFWSIADTFRRALLAAHARIKELMQKLQELGETEFEKGYDQAREELEPRIKELESALVFWHGLICMLQELGIKSPAPDSSVGPELSPRPGAQDDTEEAP